MATPQLVAAEGVPEPMITIQKDAPEKDAIALVGEYALHLLDVGTRLTFEKHMACDPALQKLLHEWEECLASLADEIQPVTPPPHLKRVIEAKLFDQSETPIQKVVFAKEYLLSVIAELRVSEANKEFYPTATVQNPSRMVKFQLADSDKGKIANSRKPAGKDTSRQHRQTRLAKFSGVSSVLSVVALPAGNVSRPICLFTSDQCRAPEKESVCQ